MHVVADKHFFISMTHGPRRAMGHVAVPDPTSEPGHNLKLMEACQRQSPHRRQGGVQCQGTCGSVRALLNGEVGSEASRHVAALEP
jgi:hypothetical protein